MPGTNVIVPAGTLATLDGIWRVVPITSIVLPPGDGYIVGGMNSTANGCLSSNVTQTVHPDIFFVDAAYGASGPVLTEPVTHSSATNGFYGPGFQIDGFGLATPFCFGDGSGLSACAGTSARAARAAPTAPAPAACWR